MQFRNERWLDWDWGKVLELVMSVDIATEVGTLIRAMDLNVAEAKKWFSRFVTKSAGRENSRWHDECCQENKKE